MDKAHEQTFHQRGYRDDKKKEREKIPSIS